MLNRVDESGRVLAKGLRTFCLHVPEHVCGRMVDGKIVWLPDDEMTYTSDGSRAFDERGLPIKGHSGVCID